MSYNFLDDTLERFVHSAAFDSNCVAHAHWIAIGSPSDDSDSEYRPSLWEMEPPSSPYDVSNFEAYLYYFGLRGLARRGPKLIFRTSKDVYTPPEPEGDARRMQLLPVYEHRELGKNDLWATIRSKVVELLDQRNIQHSSVDLVRFSWVEETKKVVEDEDGVNKDRDDDDEHTDAKYLEAVESVSPYKTPVTIWVGVLPNTLTGDEAFHSSNDILDLLKEHGISDVDVAYRESVARGLGGPELFAPVNDSNSLKAVIDPVTTAVGFPIAGLQTLQIQGTMGFYFKVEEVLYAVTARHVLFPEDEGNNSYSYVAGPKKEVVLMGTKAFSNFLRSIQGHIGRLNSKVQTLEQWITALTARSEGGGSDAGQAAGKLVEHQCELGKTRTGIEELKKFYVRIKKQWTNLQDRVIGHVVWAPPISAPIAPHGYTRDVCVIKLDTKKFWRNLSGNVLDLGLKIDTFKFLSLMGPCIDAPSDFDYSFDDHLLKLRGILSAEALRRPNNLKGEPIRHVLKSGLATETTIGCLTGFESHVRRYFAVGNRDSVEAAVIAYTSDGKRYTPFSNSGDSGSIIVDCVGRLVALLTGGTGSTYYSDITYGSPMHWLWEIIQAQFPGAKLDQLAFEDDSN